MIADYDGAFTRQAGQEVDLTEAGLGKRSKRCVIIQNTYSSVLVPDAMLDTQCWLKTASSRKSSLKRAPAS